MADRARESGQLNDQALDEVAQATAALPALVEDVSVEDGRSLIHGDLWAGNVLFDGSTGPVLIDPAVYVGHREVDLAMTELFGGFGPAFYEGYESTWPLHPGYEPQRKAAYQLYPLLVHVNLFGGSYVTSTRSCARVVASGA